ncbi:Domain of uncharacterised function (DUF932) [Serratia ficaria]|uniref:DUF932 domain-containing protein n=1 Tax=Serratia ficaria TaxID=61651 RepID=UPI00217AE881|nr:DUF932 domain-containing protein [Serratia ficaria]CAI2149709.1 Domain of uncharacterised function (DUF932) [Serratia ficaria]CAI2535491.1 Domain of uncharacterised function (DUF932) [Serratia ficaria]HEI9813447.1 DUF945 domain-containing protein [Serratia marcescens]
MRLTSRFGHYNAIRKDRPLTNDELMNVVPSVFSEDKHDSRSDRYTYIPTITLLDKLREEGFQPFYACQTRVRDESKRGHTKHMLRLRRENMIVSGNKEVPEIVLLNSHDGSSSYQMIPGMFRYVCANGMVFGQSFGDVRVPHKGDVVGQVIEGAYEVLGIFDRVDNDLDTMKCISLSERDQELFARAALSYRYEYEDKSPITPSQVLRPRRREDYGNDLWTTFQRVQENMIKGGLPGKSATGKNTRTRAVNGIDGDIKLNRALWLIADEFKSRMK